MGSNPLNKQKWHIWGSHHWNWAPLFFLPSSQGCGRLEKPGCFWEVLFLKKSGGAGRMSSGWGNTSGIEKTNLKDIHFVGVLFLSQFTSARPACFQSKPLRLSVEGAFGWEDMVLVFCSRELRSCSFSAKEKLCSFWAGNHFLVNKRVLTCVSRWWWLRCWERWLFWSLCTDQSLVSHCFQRHPQLTARCGKAP